MRERVIDGLLAAAVALPFAVGLGVGPGVPDAEVAFAFRDPAVVESSGLVARDGLVLTTNDSGDTGRVFAVEPATGRTVGVTTWSQDPVDVEALAPADGPGARPGEVWVGDIGDNPGERTSVSVTRVAVGRGALGAAGTTYELVYPDGGQDAETLLVEPRSGRLLVASKAFLGGTLYRAPARLSPDAPNRLEPVGSVLSIATDGAFFPDGRHLVVRGYGGAVVYAWPSMEEVADLDLPTQQQGEGIAVDEDGRVLLSSEGQYAEVLELDLPADVRAVVDGTVADRADRGDQADRAGREAGRDPDLVTVTDTAELTLLTGWMLGGALAVLGLLVGLVVLLRRRR
ncbi:hypothetical protein [Nocardioides sp. Leaf374]|uniref:hypothetical protein n=1 Tax=Nocardioides sp. Leaf374 TaxID=2876560 RepID=UPI001E3002E9|nr:hypothetical protein [Nocardioides sp. Leaf374]